MIKFGCHERYFIITCLTLRGLCCHDCIEVLGFRRLMTSMTITHPVPDSVISSTNKTDAMLNYHSKHWIKIKLYNDNQEMIKIIYNITIIGYMDWTHGNDINLWQRTYYSWWSYFCWTTLFKGLESVYTTCQA